MTSSAATIRPQPVPDTWQRIAAPIPPGIVQWRQQGRGKPRDGKHYAPFVAYIDAQFVRERLDEVVSGEWDLSLELLPPASTGDGEEIEPFAFKARLQILGVIREDVGSGKDYKTAATDAFKRAAVRFGIAHELYTDYEIVWVQVDGDGKYAKAVEDPAEVWARKSGSPLPQGVRAMSTNTAPAPARETAEYDALQTRKMTDTDKAQAAAQQADAECPKCGGRMFDNRASKRNPKAPDFKCRDRSCDGVIWPPKATKASVRADQEQHAGLRDERVPDRTVEEVLGMEESDDLPF